MTNDQHNMTTSPTQKQGICQIQQLYQLQRMNIPSPPVRSNKRKGDDRVVVGSYLSFNCSTTSTEKEEETVCKHAVNALRELAQDSQFDEDDISYEGTLVPLVDTQNPSKKTKMSRVQSMPTLSDSLNVASSIESDELSAETFSASMRLADRIKKSASAPVLQNIETQSINPEVVIFANTNPETHMRTILCELGLSPTKSYNALDLKDFFHKVTEENISSYGTDIITAVCQGDIATLRKMHREGRMMQCCNRFGESIVHTACRRGAIEVVRFLLEEAGVTFRLCDDYGRTPLHDAFWTREPEPELVKMLITQCPDMLLLADKRGFTPLSYVRKEHWGLWCEFLEANRDLLMPAELL